MVNKGYARIRQQGNIVFVIASFTGVGCGARTGLEASDTTLAGGGDGVAIRQCPTTFADCDRTGDCETDLNASSENCGACGEVCPAGLVCGAGTCRPPEDIIQVAAGYMHSCALRASGEVLCWGANQAGVLGDGSFEPHELPVPVLGLTDAVEIDTNTGALDTEAMCARRATGAVVCWGAGASGMLGNGSEENQPMPVEVVGLTDAASVKTSQAAACALRRDGSVWCWGRNSSGQAEEKQSGEGPLLAAPVVDLEPAVQLDIAMIDCVALATGEVACWGLDYFGWAGQGFEFLETPTVVKNVSDADSVWLPGPAMVQHTGAQCVIHAGGLVSCTGENEFGTIDIDDSPNDFVDGEMKPIEGITDAVQVVGGISGTCALRATGQVACWGDNGEGILGIGSFEQPEQTVVTVPGLEGVLHLAGAHWHICAALGAGGAVCWGANQAGQLGDGSTTEISPAPVHVLGLP